jgi:hypothetical protein
VICNNCGEEGYRFRMSESGACCCDRCGGLKNDVGFDDVYFDGPYKDPHLIDYKNPAERNGVWINSRREKAERLQKLGWRELGDKRGGARLEDKAIWRREKERGH